MAKFSIFSALSSHELGCYIKRNVQDAIGTHLGRIGDALGTHWGRIQDALGTHWGRIGDALGTHWGRIGDALGMYWGCIGDALYICRFRELKIERNERIEKLKD